MGRNNKELVPEMVQKSNFDTEKQKEPLTEASLAEMLKLNNKLNTIMKDMTEGLIILNSGLRFLYLNHAAKLLLHPVNLESIIGKELGEIFPPESLLYQTLYKSYTKQLAVRLEYNPVHTDQFLEMDIYPHKGGLLVYLRDITNRKSYVKREQNNYSRLVDVLDRISDGFYALDHDWRFVFANKGAGEFFPRIPGDLIGKVIWKVIPQIAGTVLEEKLIKAKQEKIYLKFETKGLFQENWFEKHIFPSENGLTVYFKDISERKRLEWEISRLDRLNSVGEMAACIGHEIRNPMTTVRGFLQILGEKEECLKYRESFTLMIEELDRCNSIITEFLSFAGKKDTNPELVNLNAIVEAIRPLILADAVIDDKNVIFELDPVPDLLLDRNEIRQLILNLTRNGLEAMSAGATLLIRTYWEGNEVVLLVKDQGSGIDASVIEKIGTPFVTTKEKGTGLGLPVCYRIADKNNAAISFETGSTGTTFFVRFSKK
ncbi:ATP-binding protein [Candidatus Formimonas warabiya]|uniref:histidine kinase n=1 Tax=Formimonas warabiya TaxID=1761012 RepID=A0A3G1KN82_FORW1|nr:ATP-binding protein [Candidatus Formimonas warabiya]ATW23917.1 hypothetical protein DCMF_03095 [Candidatus Formimonas warabiya]